MRAVRAKAMCASGPSWLDALPILSREWRFVECIPLACTPKDRSCSQPGYGPGPSLPLEDLVPYYPVLVGVMGDGAFPPG
jgi:hypothetical protein